MFPSPAVLSFGAIFSTVLGVAAGYAFRLSLGVILASFGIALTLILFIKSIKRISVTDCVKVGNYSLPINLIRSVKAVSHNEFRMSVTPQDLVLGARSGIDYLQFDIDSQHEPFKRWFVGTRKPNEFLATLT